MTDMITVSRKEVEALLTQLNITHQDLRALLEKAEVVSGEPVAWIQYINLNGDNITRVHLLSETMHPKECHFVDGDTWDLLYTSPQPDRGAELQDAVRVLVGALQKAEQFITNGVKIGRIRMPDDDLKGVDSAHDTPRIIREALESVEGEKWTNLV